MTEVPLAAPETVLTMKQMFVETKSKRVIGSKSRVHNVLTTLGKWVFDMRAANGWSEQLEKLHLDYSGLSVCYGPHCLQDILTVVLLICDNFATEKFSAKVSFLVVLQR